MQARIATASAARRDPDFVIIARSDELYAEGGGGGGSLEEAISRGRAYAEVGADVYLPTFATPDDLPQIAAEVPIPLAGYGSVAAGLSFSLSTGWGTAKRPASLYRRLESPSAASFTTAPPHIAKVHMPWRILPGNPSLRAAASSIECMGLSPDTPP